MSTLDSKAPLRTVKRVQFGIISPDEIVSESAINVFFLIYKNFIFICMFKEKMHMSPLVGDFQ